MTERLYYTDPYRTTFTARVVDRLRWGDHPAAILDRTLFYPESGGQPADRGRLDGAAVLDVVEREAPGPSPVSVVHVLSDPVPDEVVTGEVDWPRRFDHMQQHTGQHILSAAFERLLDAGTVGFHLGAASSTIDVDVPDLEMDDVLPVERLANQVVWDDRRVSVQFVASDEVEGLAPESLPDVAGPIRLVRIGGGRDAAGADFDINPCGGTHVARTGEIGLLKIVGLEHRGSETRIEFLCGGRAREDYEAKRRMTAKLGGMLTVGTWELDEAVARLQEENKALRHAQRGLRQRLLDLETERLAGTAARIGPYRVVGEVWEDRSAGELQILARKLAEHSDVVALLFSVGESVHLCFARAQNLDLDANQLLQEACARLDGRGGGRPQVAQGSAPKTDVETVESVLHDLETALVQKT